MLSTDRLADSLKHFLSDDEVFYQNYRQLYGNGFGRQPVDSMRTTTNSNMEYHSQAQPATWYQYDPSTSVANYDTQQVNVQYQFDSANGYHHQNVPNYSYNDQQTGSYADQNSYVHNGTTWYNTWYQ